MEIIKFKAYDKKLKQMLIVRGIGFSESQEIISIIADSLDHKKTYSYTSLKNIDKSKLDGIFPLDNIELSRFKNT